MNFSSVSLFIVYILMADRFSIGIDGPHTIHFDDHCTMGNALMTNRPEYFEHPPGADPCTAKKDTEVAEFCKENKNAHIFRTPSGECNNLDHPRWGSANSILERRLPGEYDKLKRPTYDDRFGK